MNDLDDEPTIVQEPPTWRRNLPLIIGLIVLVGIGVAAWRWLVSPPASPETIAAAPSPPAAATQQTLPPSPAEPVPAHPIDVPPDAPAEATAADLESALVDLVGKRRFQSLFRLQDLPRRIVATVDNLGREQASASLWPVDPPSGPFTTDRSGDAEVIATANYARYQRYVEMLESLDREYAVTAYRRLYPLLQKSYENLGYPGRHFNDRLVEVIDLLLATPEPGDPLRVRLPEFSEDLRPERPWVLYQFEDPALQQLSAGQRMLLRSGPDNMHRVKQVLRALRPQITRTATTE